MRCATALLSFVVACSFGSRALAEETPAKRPGGNAPAAAAAPVFEVDGRPLTPWVISMHEDDGPPREGDIAIVNRVHLMLGPGPDYRFRTTPEEDGRIYLVAADGSERVVGAGTGWSIDYKRNNAFVVINRLDPLSDAEMGALWGVHLDGWNEAIAKKVALIDPQRTCVTVTDSCGGPGRNKSRPMPSLPRGLRALILDENSSEGMTDLSPLKEQASLVLFATSGFSRLPMDPALLEPSASTLRHLRLRSANLTSTKPLERLTALHHLDLAGSRTVTDLSWVRSMASLRTLHVEGSAVNSLAPLSGLSKLESIHANASAVAVLPSGPMPALRRLEILSTKVTAEDATAFAKAQPRCEVQHGWNSLLEKALAKADRVVVRSGGTCHRKRESETRLFEGKGAEVVRELVDLLVVDESKSGDHCMCCGDPTFEFFSGEALIVTLGFHHGESLRWPGGWPGDGKLADGRGGRIADWLATRGVTGPRDARDKERERVAREERETAMFLAPFPRDAAVFFREASLGESWNPEPKKVEEFIAGMREKSGGPVALGAALCRAMGTSSTGWTELAWKEMKAVQALKGVDGESFAKALETLKGDAVALKGAARLAFREGMMKAMPEAAREVWAAPLARAALTDGEPWYAWTVARALGKVDAPDVRAILREMVKSGSPEGAEMKPSLPVAALISLAKLADPGTVEEARRRLNSETEPTERRGLEVALVLLGEPVRLHPDHFAEPWTTAFGAIDALVRSPRKEGIEALVAVMRRDSVPHGFELGDAFFEATGWSCKTEGRPYPWIHRQCVAWWEKNGAEFLKKVRPGE